jgi:hypothetical protein
MTRILRAVLKDEYVEVYVYSSDDALNAKVGKEIAHILGPEAATLFWRRWELGEAGGRNDDDDEVNLIQIAVDEEGLIAVHACVSLSDRTVTQVVDTAMRALGGDDAIDQVRAINDPIRPTIH